MRVFGTFREAALRLQEEFRYRSYDIRTEKWQGVAASKPEMAMKEILNWNFTVPLRGLESLEHWRGDIEPNLPFADIHFAERVSRDPTNPGDAWKAWPWGLTADAHRTEGGKFTHTYQERIWSKYAGFGPETLKHVAAIRSTEEPPSTDPQGTPILPNRGIRYDYGDLDDVVALLLREPLTRQAYLPIWFPEDTGAVHGGRLPCTLGYHFINRHDYFHVSYYIRSCDYIRHFRDDCYLTVRLLLWLLDELRRKDERWLDVRPGFLKFDSVSMHMFINDFRKLFPDQKNVHA